MELKRCKWADSNPLLITYHDNEWGNPVHDDRKHFEYLTLEVMQCGLNWLTVLKKREAFRKVFDDFDFSKIARYDEKKIQEIMAAKDIIHSKNKIQAVAKNAKGFIAIEKEFGTFDAYIWGFTNGKTIEYPGHTTGEVTISRNELSDQISADLKKRGFSYVGSITMYAHLQAAGIINDHRDYCFKYKCLL